MDKCSDSSCKWKEVPSHRHGPDGVYVNNEDVTGLQMPEATPPQPSPYAGLTRSEIRMLGRYNQVGK